MFTVTGRTIRLSRGDTGIIPFRVEGVTLSAEDRAVFTVKRRSGGTLLQKVISPAEDGLIYVPFTNEETDGWKPDRYDWDIRFVLGATQDADGKVTDGREVITPWPPGVFEVVKVVGEV